MRQRGSSAESQARALRADQGLYSIYSVYAKLESNSEQEGVCQRVAVRASESQSGSLREPVRARERQGEIQ